MITQFRKNEFKNGFGVSNLLGVLIFCYISGYTEFRDISFRIEFCDRFVTVKLENLEYAGNTHTKCEWMMFSTSARITPACI